MQTSHKFESYYEGYRALDPRIAIWTEAGFITVNTNLGVNGGPTVLEDWQIFLLNSSSGYSWWGKSRQVGFSWAEAMKKLARSYLIPKIYARKYLGIFLSLNQDEAKEKIFYVLSAWATLPKELREGPLRLVRESTDALEFANGSRILSYPARAVRGKAGADVTLDEFAHIPKVKAVYEGTTASTIRGSSGDAGITIGSTPLSETDLFYEIGHNPLQYRSFASHRFFVRWWDSAAICQDVIAARRASESESWLARNTYEDVADRVKRFGTERLNEEFGSLPLESFLQEYESAFGSNKNAFIPYGVLEAAMEPEWPQVMYLRDKVKNAEIGLMDDVWPEIERALKMAGEIGCWVGYDVARKHDFAALVIAAPLIWGDEGTVTAAVLGRFLFRNIPFHLQEAILDRLLADHRVNRLRIDATGQGMTISENLQRKWGEIRVEMVTFTNPSKLAMASRLKQMFEAHQVLMTGDREMLRQIASVEKNVTPSGNTVIGGSTDNSHADVFWALCLALETMPMSVESGEQIGAVSQEQQDEPDEALNRIHLRDELNAWSQRGRTSYFHEEEETD
jgi:phage FluMu gp28-like protein